MDNGKIPSNYTVQYTNMGMQNCAPSLILLVNRTGRIISLWNNLHNVIGGGLGILTCNKLFWASWARSQAGLNLNTTLKTSYSWITPFRGYMTHFRRTDLIFSIFFLDKNRCKPSKNACSGANRLSDQHEQARQDSRYHSAQLYYINEAWP